MTDKIFSQKYFDILLSLYSENKFQDTIDYGLSLEEKNNFAFIYNFVGASFASLEKYKQAIFYYKSAISVDPKYFEVFINLAETYRILKKYELAIETSEFAININNNSIKGYFTLANIYDDCENFKNAILYYDKVLNIEPDNFQANNNIGVLYFKENNIHKAIEHYNIALKKNSKSPEIYNNLGLLLKETNKKNSAIKCFKNALDLDGEFIDANYNMANVLKDIKNNLSSISFYEKVLSLNPNHVNALSQKLFQLAQICEWKKINKHKNEIKKIGLKKNEVEPFTMLTFDDSPKRNQQRSSLYYLNRFKTSKKTNKSLFIKKNKRKKIKLGYFSADFYNHATMFLISRMLELHDKKKFELYGYSFGNNIQDEMQTKCKKIFKLFKNINLMPDDEVLKLVNNDQIDIAIDLKGYTQNHRASLFYRKLAPIQINFLGYPGTMGSNIIDYIIADKQIIPDNHKKYYSEKVLYLPHTYQPTNNKRKISKKKFTKIECHLPKDSFVFCCFNNNYKITNIEFKIWMKLLKKVSNSVLWLIKSNEYVEKNIKGHAFDYGVEPERIIFAEFLANDEHLSRHSCADLFLDTFNYNAHTTACDSLWAGLPVITKIGNGFASRVSSSLLNAINLPELVTKTNEEYESLAYSLACNPKELTRIKEKLKTNIPSSNLFNTEKFTRDYEDLLVSTVR